MKKIAFACLLLLSAAGFFFACQKETVVTAPETAAAAQDPVASREESGICSYQVTIYGAAGTSLCGTAVGDEGTCAVCEGTYGRFTINFNTMTKTMLGPVFSIFNPTNVTKTISFTVAGAACSSISFWVQGACLGGIVCPAASKTD